MKARSLICIVTGVIFLFACNRGNYNSYDDFINYEKHINELKQISPLLNIEEKITYAFVFSIQIHNTDSLSEIRRNIHLNLIPKYESVFDYWEAYCIYNIAIAYFSLNQFDDMQKSINEGVALLEKTKRKNSEHYVLLAQMLGMKIGYSNDNNSSVLVNTQYKKYTEKSIELDTTNPRAYLSLALSEFFSPNHKSGKSNIEVNLLKVISLKDKTIDNQFVPSWGKNWGYYYLIIYYLNKDKSEKARLLYNKAQLLYPNDLRIQRLSANFK